MRENVPLYRFSDLQEVIDTTILWKTITRVVGSNHKKKVSELLGKGKFQDKGKEPEPIISIVATEATKTLADHLREMPQIPANISKNCIDLFLKNLSKYLCPM